MLKLPTVVSDGEYMLVENIDDLEALRDYLLDPSVPCIYFDLETTGLKWMEVEILCLSFSGRAGEGFVVPIFHNPGDGVPEVYPGWDGIDFNRVVDVLREIFGSSKEKCGHNVIYDTRLLERDSKDDHIEAVTAFGIKVNGTLKDTELLNHSIEESLPHNMDSVIARWLDMEHYSGPVAKYKKQMNKAPNEIIWPYSCADADSLPRLWDAMRPVADAEEVSWVLDNITTPMLRVCRDIEDRGVPINYDYFMRLNAIYEMEIAKAEAALWQAVPTRPPGWKYNDARTLRKVLFTELGLPPSSRKTDGSHGCDDCADGVCFKHDSTAKDALQEMIDNGCNHPALLIIMQLKFLTKRHSTYLAGGKGGFKRHIRPDGRIHPSMKISRTETGRLASEEPNCQNIPSYVHLHPIGGACVASGCTGPDCIEAHDHCHSFYQETFGINSVNAFHDMIEAPLGKGLLSIDWAQLEIWVLAYTLYDEFGDRSLLDIVESGDIHLIMAREMYPEIDPNLDDVSWAKAHKDLRRRAKAANFGIGYGLTDFGYSQREGVTIEEAADIIKRWKARIPVDRYFKLIRQRLFRDKYVANRFKRRRHIKHLEILKAMDETRDLEGAIREGINMPIQGGGSDLHSYTSRLANTLEALRERGCYVILSIHDSLTFEFDWPDDQYAFETAWIVKDLFTQTAWDMLDADGKPLNWKVPAEVTWGKKWGTDEFMIDAAGAFHDLRPHP